MRKMAVVLITVSLLTGLMAGCGASQSGQNTEKADAERTAAERSDAADTAPVKTGEAAAEKEEPATELHIYSMGEDFKNRMQFFYPEYTVTGDQSGMIGDLTVQWHVYSDEQEYRDALDEALEQRTVDLYVVQENFLRDYVESGMSSDVVSEVGLTEEELADQFLYTKQIATDQGGRLKAVTWQATPGVFAYRRSIAKEVLGTDDPDEVQEYVSDWEQFEQTAEMAKESGYYMLSGYGDAYQVYSDNVSSAWVENGALNIDPHLEEWALQTYDFARNGYTHGTQQWSEEWRADHTGDGQVFGFFYSSWGIHYTLQDKAEGNSEEDEETESASGDYAVCRGPEPSHFGGQWIMAAPGSDDPDAVREIMRNMTCNPQLMKKITADIHEFTNTISGMKELAESGYSAEVLGGQNPLPVYLEVAQQLTQMHVTSYDDDLDLGFQVSMEDYFAGRVSQTEALETFRKVALERYEELEESTGEEEDAEDVPEEEEDTN